MLSDHRLGPQSTGTTGVSWFTLKRDTRPSSKRWVIVRDRDGFTWAGPYRWQGETFTKAHRYWYQFANVESAHAAIKGHEFVGVAAKRIV